MPLSCRTTIPAYGASGFQPIPTCRAEKGNPAEPSNQPRSREEVEERGKRKEDLQGRVQGRRVFPRSGMSTLKAREEHGKGLGQIPRAAKKEREEAIIPKEDRAFLLEE